MTPLDYIKDGAEIYRRSFATIRREAELSRFSPLEERIAVRIIQACRELPRLGSASACARSIRSLPRRRATASTW